jgi:hypothetical protein
LKDSDYTSLPLGTLTERGKEIVACPKCKKPGAVTRYPDGSENYTHRARPFGVRETVLEACLVLPPPARQAR